MARYFFILCLCIFYACQNAPNDQSKDWIPSVEQLESIEMKKMFLDSIYREFLVKRKELSTALNTFGYDSPQHLKKKKTFSKSQNLHYAKVNAYLNTHGYPSIMELGGVSAYTPYMVIQSMPDLERRERNFTYLYDAYVFGNITVDLFYNYLSEIYYLKKGKNYLYDPNVPLRTHIENILSALNYD